MGVLRFLFIVFICAGHAQYADSGENPIAWDPDRKLKWSDFQGKPPSISPIAALSASGISYSFSSMQRGDERVINFTVTAHFYPSKSWYRPNRANANVLAHEQLHFDITELFARKFKKRLTTTRFTENIKEEVSAIFESVNKELAEYQDRYDIETNSSRLLEAQNQWKRRVARALEAAEE